MIPKFGSDENKVYLIPECESDQQFISHLSHELLLADFKRTPSGDYLYAEVKLERPVNER